MGEFHLTSYSSGSSCFTMCPMLLYCMLNFSRLQSAFNSTTLNQNKIFFRVAFCQTFCIMIINRISPFIEDSPLISGTPRVMPGSWSEIMEAVNHSDTGITTDPLYTRYSSYFCGFNCIFIICLLQTWSLIFHIYIIFGNQLLYVSVKKNCRSL